MEGRWSSDPSAPTHAGPNKLTPGIGPPLTAAPDAENFNYNAPAI